MLWSKTVAIRATSERDELVREARRLADVVTNIGPPAGELADAAATEIGAAAREAEQVGRLAESLDGAAELEERATIRRLRELAAECRRRRHHLRDIRRRLLADYELAA